MEETGSSTEVSSTELVAGSWFDKYQQSKLLINRILNDTESLKREGGVPSLFSLVRRKMLHVKPLDTLYKLVGWDDLFPGSPFRFSGLDYLIRNIRYSDPDEWPYTLIAPPDPLRHLFRTHQLTFGRSGKPKDDISYTLENHDIYKEPSIYEYQIETAQLSQCVLRDFTSSNFLTLMCKMFVFECYDDAPYHEALLPQPHQVKLDSFRLFQLFRDDVLTYFHPATWHAGVPLKPVVSFQYSSNIVTLLKGDDCVCNGKYTMFATTFTPMEVSRRKVNMLGQSFQGILDICNKRNYEVDYVPTKGDCIVNRGVRTCYAHVDHKGVECCVEIYTHDLAIPTVFSIYRDGEIFYPLGIYLDFIDIGMMDAMDKRALKGLYGKDRLNDYCNRWYSHSVNLDAFAESYIL